MSARTDWLIWAPFVVIVGLIALLAGVTTHIATENARREGVCEAHQMSPLKSGDYIEFCVDANGRVVTVAKLVKP